MDLFQNTNLKNKYIFFYRKVKHLRIEVQMDIIKVIVPENYSLNIEYIIQKHRNWIEGKIKYLQEAKALSENLVLYNQEGLRVIVQNYINEYGEILKVRPMRILFRKMRIRWGSCQPKGRQLIFNKDLKFLPEDLIKYLVLHEMCHLIVRNHNKAFWRLVSKFDCDYKEREKILSSYRFKLDKIVKEKERSELILNKMKEKL